MKFIKKAFTLAEVVMVMGIIGIVATLTVTNATKSTDVAEKVAQLKRTEEILAAAFVQAVGDYGSISTWSTTTDTAQKSLEEWNIWSQYLKLQKKCGTSSGCWKDGEVKEMDDSEDGNINTNSYPKAVLANGVSIYYHSPGYSSALRSIVVDVDGKDRGVYKYGHDVFRFIVESDGVVSYHGKDSIFENNCKNNEGLYCTGWVIRFGNQDYLKSCKSKLSWDGKHSCKE